jgi:DNA-binding NarL/FixJ family response regulator
LYSAAIGEVLGNLGYEIKGIFVEPDHVLDVQPLPAVVILDAGGVEGSLEDTIGALRAQAPKSRVVILADAADAGALYSAYVGGADGAVHAGVSPRVLAASLELVLTGERVFPSLLLQQAATASGPAGKRMIAARLTERDRAVIRALAKGLSNRDIAAELGLAEGTVKARLRRIRHITRQKNRTQVATWALNNPDAIDPEKAPQATDFSDIDSLIDNGIELEDPWCR